MIFYRISTAKQNLKLVCDFQFLFILICRYFESLSGSQIIDSTKKRRRNNRLVRLRNQVARSTHFLISSDFFLFLLFTAHTIQFETNIGCSKRIVHISSAPITTDLPHAHLRTLTFKKRHGTLTVSVPVVFVYSLFPSASYAFCCFYLLALNKYQD